MTGLIYSFYSYKGGVGRSMALANLATLFFRRPLDVIVVDWDLEAPGIERYLMADSAGIEHRRGLSDLLLTYRSRLAEPPEPGERPPSPYPDLDDHLVTIESVHDCSLRLLTAGDRSDWSRYANFVQSFDWSDFYANWGGGGFFEWLREELNSRADLVLIDTRTGITEMGGVATRQMADVIIVLFSGNEENMASSARMAKSFLAVDADERAGRPISVMMVPSRIDDSDSTEFAGFHARLTELESLLPTQLQDGYRVRDMLLPYRARLAFREQLVIGNETLETVLGPLVEGYNRIAANMQQLAPEDSRLRAGAGVAQERVYLLSKPEQINAERHIRQILTSRQFEVLPSTAGTDLDPNPSELASSTCVLVLLDRRAVTSRHLRQVMSQAERLAKTVIPVLLEQPLDLPLALSDVVALDWSVSEPRSAERLIDAVQGRVTGRGHQREQFEDRPLRIYITYSAADREMARRIESDLIAEGLNPWLDVQRIAAGSRWRDEAQQALDLSDALVVLVSPALRADKDAAQQLSYASKADKRILPLQISPIRLRDLPLGLASVQLIPAFGTEYRDAIRMIANTVRQVRTPPTDKLARQNELARDYEDSGRIDDAIGLYQDSLTELWHTVGHDHPDALAALSSLAGLYASNGRNKEALGMYESVLEGRLQALGPNHIDTLESRFRVAQALAKTGRVDSAIDMYQETLAGRAKALGPTHPTTLTTRSNLAGAFLQAGLVSESIMTYQVCVEDCERAWGPDSHLSLDFRFQLAKAYLAADLTDDAIAKLETVVADSQRVLGSDHPDTIARSGELALAYQAADRVYEAAKVLQDMTATAERLSEGHDPNSAAVQRILQDVEKKVRTGGIPAG